MSSDGIPEFAIVGHPNEGKSAVVSTLAEDDTVAPGRDLGSITLAEILDAVRHETPNPRSPDPRRLPAADNAARLADDSMRASLSQTTLRDLLRDPEPPRAGAVVG